MSVGGDLISPSEALRHKRGVIIILVAIVVMICQDAITKKLAQDYAISQFVFLRFLVFAIFIVGYLAQRGRLKAAVLSKRPVLQIFRSILIVTEIGVFALSLRFLGLAEAHALFVTYPLWATALATLLLGEKIGWRRVVGLVLGFVGALVIIRPGLGVFDLVALIPLGAAAMFALYNILTRMASFTDSFETSMFYFATVGLVCAAPFGITDWQNPSPQAWLLMGVLSCTGIIAHVLLIKALELAPASLLQPFNYTSLIWAVIIGFLVYGNLPDWATIGGALLIVAGGAFVIWSERRRARLQASNNPPKTGS